MANSQNSTSTTRRNLLSGIAATTAAAVIPITAAAAATSEAGADVDAVLEAWRIWRALEEEMWPLRSKLKWKLQQVPVDVDSPSVEVCGKTCQFEHHIDQACDAAPAWMQASIEEIRKAAKKELTDGWLRREAFYRKVGLAELEDREAEITGLQSPLICIIEDAAGSAPIIVAAKLDLAVSTLDPRAEFGDTPQIYIADAVRGLLPELPDDMRAKLAPIAAADDIVKAVYWPRPAEVPKTA